MYLIIEALATVGMAFGVFWLVGVARSAGVDRKEAARVAAEEKKLADTQERLNRQGEPLRCLNCNTDFKGPLTDDGCPNCHLSTLVTPIAELNQQAAY